MLDRRVLELSRGFLTSLAVRMAARGIRADQVSWFGFVVGLAAVPLIVLEQPSWAILPILVNRMLDGVDGALARQVGATDRGAFLDIALDFLFYSSIPLAFALADPATNALAAAVLIYAFVGTGSTFLAFAVIAAKRGLTSTAYPGKGFYYLGGLTEALGRGRCLRAGSALAVVGFVGTAYAGDMVELLAFRSLTAFGYAAVFVAAHFPFRGV